MKKQNHKHKLISWGLFVSLLIPMLLDGLHFAIFHHDDDKASTELQYNTLEQHHILCSYPFVTEELSETFVYVAPIERLFKLFFSGKKHLAENTLFFPNPLRGPPYKA